MKNQRHQTGSRHRIPGSRGRNQGRSGSRPRGKAPSGQKRHQSTRYPGIEMMSFPFGYGLPGI